MTSELSPPEPSPPSTWEALRASRRRSLFIVVGLVGAAGLLTVLAYTLPRPLTARDDRDAELLAQMEPEAKRAAERHLAWHFVNASGHKVTSVSPTRGGYELFVQSNAVAAEGTGYRGGCDSCYVVYVSRDGSSVKVQNVSGGK